MGHFSRLHALRMTNRHSDGHLGIRCSSFSSPSNVNMLIWFRTRLTANTSTASNDLKILARRPRPEYPRIYSCNIYISHYDFLQCNFGSGRKSGTQVEQWQASFGAIECLLSRIASIYFNIWKVSNFCLLRINFPLSSVVFGRQGVQCCAT